MSQNPGETACGAATSDPTGQAKRALQTRAVFPQHFHSGGNRYRGVLRMNFWDKVLQHTERRVNPHSFATWFRPTRQERVDGNRLIIRVPTRLFCKRLKETYGELLKAVLAEVGMPELILEFICADPEPVLSTPAP